MRLWFLCKIQSILLIDLLIDSVLNDGIQVCCVHDGKSDRAELEISVISKCCYCINCLESHAYDTNDMSKYDAIKPSISLNLLLLHIVECKNQEAASTKSTLSMNTDSSKLNRWHTV